MKALQSRDIAGSRCKLYLRYCRSLIPNIGHLCRHQAHVSGLILIYHTVILKLLEQSEDNQTYVSRHVEYVCDVLDFCKKLDPVARAMSENLSGHLSTVGRLQYWLSAHGTQFCTIHSSKQKNGLHWRIVDIFIDTLPGTSGLAQALRRLVAQVSDPFHVTQRHHERNRDHRHSNPTAVHPSASMIFPDPASMSIAQANFSKPLSPPFFGAREAGFPGTQEPLWWLNDRSSDSYTIGAQTLSIM